LDQPVI